MENCCGFFGIRGVRLHGNDDHARVDIVLDFSHLFVRCRGAENRADSATSCGACARAGKECCGQRSDDERCSDAARYDGRADGSGRCKCSGNDRTERATDGCAACGAFCDMRPLRFARCCILIEVTARFFAHDHADVVACITDFHQLVDGVVRCVFVVKGSSNESFHTNAPPVGGSPLIPEREKLTR